MQNVLPFWGHQVHFFSWDINNFLPIFFEIVHVRHNFVVTNIYSQESILVEHCGTDIQFNYIKGLYDSMQHNIALQPAIGHLASPVLPFPVSGITASTQNLKSCNYEKIIILITRVKVFSLKMDFCVCLSVWLLL